MILELYTTIKVLITQIVMLLSLPTSYLKNQRALQWWQTRQSMQLLSEAEKIRDGLLQDSFTIRRHLERSLSNPNSTSTQTNLDCLEQIEQFHHALEQLSDRLSPIHINYSLPLAIQYLLESWQTCHLEPQIELELPTDWQQEPVNRHLIILKILDELLRITFSVLVTAPSIHLSLKQQRNIGELIVRISYPDVATLIRASTGEDIDNLSQTFRFLTPGQCFCRRQDSMIAWYFRWVMQ